MMKSNKGITLITLTITIVILMILTFTLTINVSQYAEEKKKADFEKDIQSLKEEIHQYYARVKQIPIINSYTNLSMLEETKNKNDNENYYVIDIKQLDVNLNYGKDYKTITASKEITEEITDLRDVYIINEQSHTIYYPKGIKYKEKVYYRLPEVFSEI